MSEFLRKMIISTVVSSCIVFGFWTSCIAYEQMQKIGFGENKSAVEITSEEIRFFDFNIKLK